MWAPHKVSEWGGKLGGPAARTGCCSFVCSSDWATSIHMRTKELSLWSWHVHHLKGWGTWAQRGSLGAKVNHEPTAGWFFFFSFKMILLKVFIEPHPDSRSSCQADPVKTSCSSSAAAVESMQGTEWWQGTIFSPPNDLWKRTVSLILGNPLGSWKIQVEVYREASPQGKTGFAAEINISRPKELVRNITTVTLFIRHTKRSHLEWNS